MQKINEGFQERVYALVAQIPVGKVVSYGQVALLCGNPRAARVVGGIAHLGDQALPWHRVIYRDGRLAVGYPGGVEGQKSQLEKEGIHVNPDYRIDIKQWLWKPG